MPLSGPRSLRTVGRPSVLATQRQRINRNISIDLPLPPDGFGYFYYTDKNGQNQFLYEQVGNTKIYPLVRI